MYVFPSTRHVKRLAAHTHHTMSDLKHPLLEGLNTLRTSHKFTDVTLIVQGQRFKAHRVILAACSDYFNAMFSDNMIESRKEEIVLHGVTALAFEQIIDFIYTSKLQLNNDNVEELLATATHIQMNDVVAACVHFLETKINLDNCVPIATLANRYMQQSLKRKVFRFLCSHLKEFAKCAEADTEASCLKRDDILYILSSNFPVDLREFELLQFTLNWCHLQQEPYKSVAELLQHIHFECIMNTEMTTLEDAMQANVNANSNATLTEYYNLALAHYRRHMRDYYLYDFESSSSSSSSIGIGSGLCNTRGMELALLKIGGFELQGLTNKISYFSPSLRMWHDLTTIPHIDQCNYGTAVLGNQLFIVGGSYDVCLKEYIHPFGFRYCPLRDDWDTIAPIQSDRCRFSLNAVGPRYLYAVGGVVEPENDEHPLDDILQISNVERYDVLHNSWSYQSPLVENRSQHAGTVIGDKLYISGGITGHVVLATFWCFDTKDETWTQLQSMPTPRCDHVLIAFDHKVYACGGWYENHNEVRVLIKSIDVYDADTDEWIYETEVPSPKFYTGVAALGRQIYFVGGLQSTDTLDRASSETLTYDVDTKVWQDNADELAAPKEVWELTCTTLYLPKPGVRS